jgi:hypothetical protein
MDRKDPFVLILMITLFGVAVAAAIWIFTQKNIQVRRDSMVADITRIAADAYQYRLRPASMGGGGGSYLRYAIPAGLRSNQLGTYEISQRTSADTLVIEAEADRGAGTILAGVDQGGSLHIISMTGDLAR